MVTKNIFIALLILCFLPSVFAINLYANQNMQLKNITNATLIQAVRFSGDGSALTNLTVSSTSSNSSFTNGSSINVKSMIMNLSTNATGVCYSRPLFSTANVTINVPADYTTINAAMCAVPINILQGHTIYIVVNPATYTANEHVLISNVHGAAGVDYAGGELRLSGGGAGNMANVASIFVTGITGEENPKIQYFNVTAASPYYTPNSSCKVCLFGVQQADLYTLNLVNQSYGPGQPHGILVYGGSTAKLAGIAFYNSSYFGVSVKQGSSAIIRDDTTYGNVTGFAFNAAMSSIYYTYGTAVYGGLATKYKNNYLNDEGFLFGYAYSGEQNIWGIDQYNMERLKFSETGDDYLPWNDTLTRGFLMDYDVDGGNQLLTQAKDGASTYVNASLIDRDTGKYRFQYNRINVKLNNTCSGSCDTGDIAWNLNATNATKLCVCYAANTWKSVLLT